MNIINLGQIKTDKVILKIIMKPTIFFPPSK